MARPGHRHARGPRDGGARGPAARGQGHLRQDRAAHPRRARGAGDATADPDAHGRGARRGGSAGDAHRDVPGCPERDRGRVRAPRARDGRRPGPAGRDRPARGGPRRGAHDGRRGARRGGPARRRAPGVGAAAARPPGRRDDLCRPGRGGTYLVHFTGSAAHNVRLRERARDRAGASRSTASRASAPTARCSPGTVPSCAPSPPRPRSTTSWSCRSSSPSCARTGARSRRRWRVGCPPWSGRRPAGRLPLHSEWSDGKESIETVAETARRRGYAYQVLTDHSWSLTIANGLSPAQVEQQRGLIGELNERFAREEAAGEAPEGPIRRASGCCTAVSWRSGSMAASTTRTTCWRATTSSSRHCTWAASSRAPSSWRATRRRCAARTWTSSPTHPAARSASDRTSTSTGRRSTGSRPRPARCWRSTAPTSGWTSTTGASAPRSTRAAASPSTPTPTTCRSGTTSCGARPRLAVAGWKPPRGQHPAARRVPGAHGGEAPPDVAGRA